MKEMEAKTENRYEYRKPQEKRKQMIAPDLFEFAYVPDWYGHLAELERLALPESWKFRKPSRETKNADTPILERYIHTIFRKQIIDFNSESDPRKADSFFIWKTNVSASILDYTHLSISSIQSDICSTKLNGGKANEGKNNSRKQKRHCKSDGGNP